MKRIKEKNVEVVLYEPDLLEDEFYHSNVKSLDALKEVCDVIISNRMVDEIEDASDKVYTRDLFGSD